MLEVGEDVVLKYWQLIWDSEVIVEDPELIAGGTYWFVGLAAGLQSCGAGFEVFVDSI